MAIDEKIASKKYDREEKIKVGMENMNELVAIKNNPRIYKEYSDSEINDSMDTSVAESRMYSNYHKADSKIFSRSESKDNFFDNDHDNDFKRHDNEFKSDMKMVVDDEFKNYTYHDGYKGQLESVPEVDDTDLLKWRYMRVHI
jgi:hypothetical protein